MDPITTSPILQQIFTKPSRYDYKYTQKVYFAYYSSIAEVSEI
jgi:hypothetical protein